MLKQILILWMLPLRSILLLLLKDLESLQGHSFTCWRSGAEGSGLPMLLAHSDVVENVTDKVSGFFDQLGKMVLPALATIHYV